jgi:hypothetical protein
MLQSFYNGLIIISRAHHDATIGGALLDLTIAKATVLIEKMDLVLKSLDEWVQYKDVKINYAQAIDSHLMCEVCGNGGHSGNDCPEASEDATYINNNNSNNGDRPQGGHGWGQAHPPYQGGGNNYNSIFNSNFNSNQPSLKDLVFGQAKINESLNKKLAANDKILENIKVKLEVSTPLSEVPDCF